jgi:hypothetical protein
MEAKGEDCGAGAAASGGVKQRDAHGWRNTVETKLQRAREGHVHINKYLGHAQSRSPTGTFRTLLDQLASRLAGSWVA